MSSIPMESGAKDMTVRRGGREARRAMRAAPLAENERPVRPGLEGGRYKPLSDAEVLKIHNAAIDVLEQIGMADAIPSGIEAMTKAGAIMNSNGRLTFPRAVIEDTLAKAARHFPLYAQDPRYDMEPWGKKVYFGTAGAAVHMVDPVTGEYRDSETKDLYDIARIVDTLDHVHFFQRSVVCRELADPYEMDFNTCYASVAGTTKHVGSSWVDPKHLEASLEMLHMIAGSEAKWRERPFVSQSNCFVVPPLKFAQDACRCLEVAVRGGMPVLLLSAGQAGATAPAALAGAIVQEVAECLAGLVYVNAIKPGAPAIFGTWCFVSDLRTGAMSGGSSEQALLSAASAQMAQFYDLTGGTASGMTDAKLPDAQSGSEKAYNHALVGNAGANLIYESAGMQASLLGFCLESLLIDNDIIGATQRTIKGIDTSDESLSIETIRKTCLEGPGHYLGSEQTLQRMQTEYVYPLIGDRANPKEWVEMGRPDAVAKAQKKLKPIMSSHFPQHISREVDDAIRAKFPVRLAREHMAKKV
ncbi:trimethylamine methyltransferase family protein [Dongia sp.]|uniref:trimethylamine methyltransferase family protein n=1 Tax=Dongia sp. TaxID=1977262 RepID=UPI0035AF8334